MSLKDDVLYELLNTDDYISGEYLADKYGKSRAAVWKAVKALSQSGYSIDAVTNKGYRLTNDDIIRAQSIKANLKSDIDVIHYPSIDSTNNGCKRLLADGRGGEFLIVADTQTAGRGRQGKSFYSPADNGIYFSLALRPYTSLQNAVTATTAAAVAVCKSIEMLTDKKPKIKWVNDVYLDGKKICGILTEAITDFEAGIVDSIIIGIGINLSTDYFPEDVENAGKLDSDVNKNLLISEIVNALVVFANGSYEDFIDYYRSHSLVLGKQIRIIGSNGVTNATAISIDKTGGLEVELESGERQILRSGEISVRF